MTISLAVNGQAVSVDVDPTTPLLDVLRNQLNLKGSRYGCGLEQCGACMVLIDGEAAYSCAREIGSLVEHSVTTIEGLGTPTEPHPLQIAFLEEQGGQCGYCLSGIIISAKALLDRNPSPRRAEIASALDKHLCQQFSLWPSVARLPAASNSNRGLDACRVPKTAPHEANMSSRFS